jgi:hypothetical protein
VKHVFSTLCLVLLLSLSPGLSDDSKSESSSMQIRVENAGVDQFIFLGHEVKVSIFHDTTTSSYLNGFDLSLIYNDSALTIKKIEIGDDIKCWEYFNYQTRLFDDCGNNCPSGLLRIIGRADVDDSVGYVFGCESKEGNRKLWYPEIARITFFVENVRKYNCSFVPIEFFWHECTDNKILCKSDANTYLSKAVYTPDVKSPFPDYEEIALPINCEMDSKLFPNHVRAVDFYNGGVSIACDGTTYDLLGDININNLSNEIADFKLYAEYFIKGETVFTEDLTEQIRHSDVNNDGNILTIADLVYLDRILTNDAIPYSKFNHFSDTLLVKQSDKSIDIFSTANLGAILLIFEGKVDFDLNLENMDFKSSYQEEKTRVLIYDLGDSYIPSGKQTLLKLRNDPRLLKVQAAGYYGNMIHTKIVN